MGILEPDKYGEQFHKLCVNNFEKKAPAEQLPKHRNKKQIDKQRVIKQHEQPLQITPCIEQIELEPNASKFAIFSAVRSTVLESETKFFQLFDTSNALTSGNVTATGNSGSKSCCFHCAATCKSGAVVDCRCHQRSKLHENNDSDNDSYTEDTTEKDVMQQVPQIVAAGLRGLFELIAEARNVSPKLCTKALQALFDVIQGQIPESFKCEPNELIQPLYDLLLDLATLQDTEPVAERSVIDDKNWSAIGCSSLLALCVARGDTGETLKAIAALLMSPKKNQTIQLPIVLSTLQRSIYSVALGKPTKPDYFKNGIPKNSLISQFSLKNQLPTNVQFHLQPSIALNGKYIFILTGKSLLKIGTGFNDTLRGYVYAVNNEFCKEKNGWIEFCGNTLFYKKMSKRSNESVLIVNTDTLVITGAAHVTIPTTRDGHQFLLFSDGESLNVICSAREDNLVAKQIYSTSSSPKSDLPLKLDRKCFRTLGYAAFEDEILNQHQIQTIQSTFNSFEPKLPKDQEVLAVVCGKEFGIVKATNGKVYYYGKSAALGLKSIGKTPTLKLTEMIISKVANIVHVAIGHDGIHAILVNDDGTVYFAGTARRGEDGDTSKNRRQPKAVKPKKLAKIDSHFIVNASCNNGTSAFVTKTGKLIMFGKDTAHCDSSGFVTDLMDQHIVSVALGKAHCVALNSKGHLFTFGLNNKGQCGRLVGKDHFTNVASSSTIASMETSAAVGPVNVDAPEGSSGVSTGFFKYDTSTICDFEEHHVDQGQCRVCTFCRECTGYNTSCVSTQNIALEQRFPGANCACGRGEAGCLKCGACATCISMQENYGANETKDNTTLNQLIRQSSKSIAMRHRDKTDDPSHQGSAEIERDTPRVAPLAPHRVPIPSTSPIIQIACGIHHTVVLTISGEVFTFGSNQYGQLGTGDLHPCVGPVQVKITGIISQIAAGSNHTVLLTSKGIVYTFGNHQKGQLGRLPSDTHVKLIGEDVLKSDDTDESHTIQSRASNILHQRQKFLWNCKPAAVFGIGPNYGKRASWIGASSDQTFFKIDESLITSPMLCKMNVVADKNTILLIPQQPLSFNCLAISRRDGTCTTHCKNQVDFAQIIATNNNTITQLVSDKCNQNIETNNDLRPASMLDRMSQSVHEARNQIFDVQEKLSFTDHHLRKKKKLPSGSTAAVGSAEHNRSLDTILPQLAFALDTCFGVLWVFDTVSKKIMCYNVIASEIPSVEGQSHLKSILSPELALPLKPEISVTRNQASLNLLACLDILTSGQDSIPSCFEQVRPQSIGPTKETPSNQYQMVSRFENFGGGWGYSGHSVEAIRFMADTDIVLYGFAMFGGRGEYTCKLKLFDLGSEENGIYEEDDGILVSETEEVPYECPARSKYNIMLPKSVTAHSGKWYLAWARISGPSSDCGSAGQATVTTEDQVVFNFKSSKKANNGTDVNSGQIPSIMYRIKTHESKEQAVSIELDPVYKISRLFANTVTKECFDSLVALLNWAWKSFKSTLKDLKDKKNLPYTIALLNQLFYINKTSLRLLRKYTNEIYPNQMFDHTDKSTVKTGDHTTRKSSEAQIYLLNQDPSTSKNAPGSVATISASVTKCFTAGNNMDATTPTNPKKINTENLQLAECIGDVRALLIQMLCDDIPAEFETEGYDTTMEILDECHVTFLSCFNAFYPTATLKWNCLCDLLTQQQDRGVLQSRLLSAIVGGLCNPTVKLRNTFSLLSSGRETKSIVSPSDNSGLPMLSSTENHQYPVLVEQMIYRTQQENNFVTNTWSFKDILLRLLEIISHPIQSHIENIYNRSQHYTYQFNQKVNQKLIDNCCHLLARVLAEIVYQSCSSEIECSFLPSRSLHVTASRFARCDVSRTWNTGNFGPDAVSFSVNRAGIAIAGAMVYSGSGSYEYQLELLYDAIESKSQHKWETLESISGTYDQDVVHNDMTEIKFERPVHIKDNARYAIRLCTQGARTCSGDAGIASIRGPCGASFSFYPCDLSFNGTTPARGQIPCLLYYSTPLRNEPNSGKALSEIHARDTALQIATDITKKCTELLVLARNTLTASMSPSDKSLNSSNNTQTIDSEQNITPIEEHFDITFANNSNTITNTPTSFSESNMSTARDLSKRIESFSKGIIETLKFEKRSTNPFEFEIEIGATEIHPKDLVQQHQDKNHHHERTLKNSGRISKINGNNSEINIMNELIDRSTCSDDDISDMTVFETLRLFENKSASIFQILLPLVFAHIGALASSDPKSSVQILCLIREMLPHVSALNQLNSNKDKTLEPSSKEYCQQYSRDENIFSKDLDDAKQHLLDLNTTSNHYCILESDHPYKSASISTFCVEFPPCVQWFTIEFDPQCGTAQPEDYLLVSIPSRSTALSERFVDDTQPELLSNADNTTKRRKFPISKNVCISTNIMNKKDNAIYKKTDKDNTPFVVKMFNTPAQWTQNALILPGNRIDLSLETASQYARDQKVNKYGFRCLIVGYENPLLTKNSISCLSRIESELAYLGGMCSANLMKKDLVLPGDNPAEDFASVEESLVVHSSLLSKGLAISDSLLTVNQALDTYLPIDGQSNERQFLKDFVNAAPGSSGARLAAWLQPEPRLDLNQCELKTTQDQLRCGWPAQLTIITRDQYGEVVYIPDLKIEIKATPSGGIINSGRKTKKTTPHIDNSYKSFALPPKIPYEPTLKDKMCFKAVTFMKAYQQYSFEELRLCSPIQTRVSETIIAQDKGDMTFGALWTPNSVGCFCLTMSIDGVALEEVYRVDVKEAGVPPPPLKSTVPKSQAPNKLRKFVAKNSAGLRIRSHPTLQSEQVGIVKMHGIVSFIDEIENDDGIWIRLSTESIRQHCTTGWYPLEAWCLQYNQHVGKTLLHPVIEPHIAKIVQTSRLRNVSQENDTNECPTATDNLPNQNSQTPDKELLDFAMGKFTPPKVVSNNPFVTPIQFDANESIDMSSSIEHPFDAANTILDKTGDNDVGPASCPIDIDGESSASPGQDLNKAQQESPPFMRFASPSSQSSQSQPYRSIAGVVGGGASKLVALQKWFKGDSLDGRVDLAKRKSDLSELASVSVRDLVKAIGGQDTKSNGNESTPPAAVSRSSSPVPIQFGNEESLNPPSSSYKSGGSADHLPAEDFHSHSEHMNGAEFNGEKSRNSGAESPLRKHFISPKNSPRKGRNKRPATVLSEKGSYGTDKHEDFITVAMNQEKFIGFGCADQPKNNLNNDAKDILSANVILGGASSVLKRALPSSLAESLRAVFAAFLWHEGIVHDAMACSSFLKFHPTLPKDMALLVGEEDDFVNEKTYMSKEQRAQQRYSVEVANAGNYLNIRPSTLETLTKSGNSSILNRRFRKNTNDAGSNPTKDHPKLHSFPELVAICPPALRCLVYLWEELCSNCVQLVQSNTAVSVRSNTIPSSKDPAENPLMKQRSNQAVSSDHDTIKLKRKKKDEGTWCELCEIFLPIPVTYHMRIVHPGCEKPAQGKGYNSVGIFCEGWAGNCGEGGKGASSWYLMCDTCREKYMVHNLNNTATTSTDLPVTTLHPQFSTTQMFGIESNLIVNSEVYAMMKENSMFLLELSATGPGHILSQQKRSPQQMPVVSETQLQKIASDLNMPGTSRDLFGGCESAARNSRIGHNYQCGPIEGIFPPAQGPDLPDGMAPELIWPITNTFSCLESLGCSVSMNQPYTIFDINSTDSGFERPLSEVSTDSADRKVAMANAAMTPTNSMSRFHRSLSMGQGWPSLKMNKCVSSNHAENSPGHSSASSKVVLRRRNNSTCDDGGSLLLCHPSENLRKLVPDAILNIAQSFVKTKPVTTDKTACYEDEANCSPFPNEQQTHQRVDRSQLQLPENNLCLLSRPAMVFIMESHNLEKLRYSLKRNLRISTCRIYSLQSLNWLIRTVTQASSLHDLMWWFVTSLKSTVTASSGATDAVVDHATSSVAAAAAASTIKIDENIEQWLDHPVTSIQICDKISLQLSQSFHKFLQTVADLTLLLPAGSALQQIAIQCFGIKFRQADHQFLHQSHVFGNISKILSRSDEQNDDMQLSSAAMLESNYSGGNAAVNNFNETRISSLVDLNGTFELIVSSRQAMVASLTDGSTETFWESDEEDRNRSKFIEISMTKINHICKMVFVHIDNSRDIQNRVSNVIFYGGLSLGDTNLIKSIELDATTGSWISAHIQDETYTHFRLEFRGTENTLRVRQIKLMGIPNADVDSQQHHLLFRPHSTRLTNATQIQQRNCEAETLRVFRLITAQVFGKLILGTDNVQSSANLQSQAATAVETSGSLCADSLDLREHMVGILFSRSKLSHLQKQVIVHIVNAIRKETQRAKDEWEVLNTARTYLSDGLAGAGGAFDEKSESSSVNSRAPDTYCFEMLSMVLALSGSTVGRSYLSHQHGLLKDLLSLLHTGSDRVQRQVTALLRRILPEIVPETMAELLCVRSMPPNDFSIVQQTDSPFDMNRHGILDIFLSVIAKSLQLQVKVKSTPTATNKVQASTVKLSSCIDLNVYNLKKIPSTIKDKSIDMVDTSEKTKEEQLYDFGHKSNKNLNEFDTARLHIEENQRNLNQRWFMKGSISVKQAENIIGLIRDMASGKFSEKWSLVTKAAIAESILNLTQLDEVFRTHENCIKTATLWLAVASLCVLDKDHVEKLSSGQWSNASETRPLCTNHDDGCTSAVIQCESCGSLCGDCDRFLHLNRKTRNHHRTVCKEEEEAIRVELHESCGRTKLFWLLALADSRTLKAMVEFRDRSQAIISGPSNAVGRCRFCGVTGNSGLLAIGNVCADEQCQDHASYSCGKSKDCGHACGGVINELKCLPCLQVMCHEKESEVDMSEPKLTQDADDMCMICFTEALSCAPAIQLECGHVFHYHCCKTVLEKRWNGPRIGFGFSQCPICKSDILHELLAKELEPINSLKHDVKRKAMMRLEYEGIIKTTDHRDLATYAMDRYAYYVCFKCQKAYFGGEARCDNEIGDKYDPTELVCGGCSDVARAQMCPKHGTDFLEYKCRYCCAVAVFFCFGTTHFCDTCHDDFQRLTNIPKSKLPQCPAGPKAKQLLGEDCPLHVVHPPTGEEFALGCGVCRNAQTF